MQIVTTSGACRRNILMLFISAVTMVFLCQPSTAGALKSQEMIRDLRSLKLGFGDYLIGYGLTGKQLDFARKHPSENSYKGTYKFQDGDVVVVASRKDNIILSVYKRRDGVSREGLRKGVAQTMNGFGEPTTMAHDRLIYWAYDQEGKITEKTFNKMKGEGKLEVLATVKFDSSIPVAGSEEEGEDEEIDYYIMVSSQPLLENFLQKQ